MQEKSAPATPFFKNISDFCLELNLEFSELMDVIKKLDTHYDAFALPKRSGGKRIINVPSRKLGIIQRIILKKLLYLLPVSSCAKAYVPGRGQRSNARMHKGQSLLLKLDLEDFFGSISERRVKSALIFAGCDAEVANTVAALCCFNGALPQGAPTSGYLSNLVMKGFDRVLLERCRGLGLRYTRYSDDISISGQQIALREIMPLIRQQLSCRGMKLNEEKFRLLRRDRQRQIVTGLVVNHTIHPGRGFLRELRQEMHYVARFGLDNHSARRGYPSAQACYDGLLGRIAYARHTISGSTPELDAWKRELIGQSLTMTRVQSSGLSKRFAETKPLLLPVVSGDPPILL